MKIGVIYPQTEFGLDPESIKEYAITAEMLGFSRILAYEHVLGANPINTKQLKYPYTYKDPFLSPFVLFCFMAAVTTGIKTSARSSSTVFFAIVCPRVWARGPHADYD